MTATVELSLSSCGWQPGAGQARADALFDGAPERAGQNSMWVASRAVAVSVSPSMVGWLAGRPEARRR
jgi:hypothetical protein